MHRFSFFFLLCSSMLGGSKLCALEMSGQVGLVEQGDDRGTGIAGITLTMPKKVSFGLYTLGYRQPPVSQTHFISHVSYPFSLDGYNILSAQIGISFAHSLTSISRSENSTSENASNLGAHFGLEASIPLTKNLHLKGGWHSFVYHAGLASIFLVSARKQALTLGLGASL